MMPSTHKIGEKAIHHQ